MVESALTSSSSPPPPPASAGRDDEPSEFRSSWLEAPREEEREEEEEEEQGDVQVVPELVLQQTSTSYRVGHAPLRSPPWLIASAMQEESSADDTLSCLIVVLTFWFFVSLTLILGIFGSEDFPLTPYSSILLQPNPLFVEYLKVEKSKHSPVAPVLYGFRKVPALGVTKTWTESLHASVKPDYHKDWVYYLNEGSQINVSYNVPSSSSLLLIIAKGIDGLAEWLEDPSCPDNTLSWNIIRGNGTIWQDIVNSYDYYIAVGNLDSEDVEVELSFSIRSSMYDITGSYYKCNLTRGSCRLKIRFPGGNAAVLNSPGPEEVNARGNLYVKISYEPRWMTYIVGIGGMTLIILWAYHLLKKTRHSNEDYTAELRDGTLGPEITPLLSQKDDDLSSLGSSYDSGSQHDEECQDFLEGGSAEGSSLEEGAKKSNSRQLCAICFDTPKDCFFIPCGHCACCFTCGTRIAEAAGTCPICRRKMKKVRRIYTV